MCHNDLVRSTTVPSATDPEGLHQILFALTDRGREAFFAHLATEQLSPPQFLLMKLLDEPRPMSSLCSSMYCDASNLTGLADRLEERGLVERRSDPKDRRVRLLALTPKGRRLRTRVQQAMIPALPGLARLSDSERQQLLQLLTKVLADDDA